MRNRRRLFAIFCCAGMLVMFVVLPVFAVPPTPPATIQIDDKELKISVREGKGEVQVPVDIRYSGEVKLLDLNASVRRIQVGKPPAAYEAIYRERVQPTKAEGMRLFVPLKISGPGHYELSIVIRGEIEPGNAFSDRKIRHILVDEQSGVRILTGKQLRSEERGMRERRFQERLKKEPENPDIRLLFTDTMPLPATVAKEIRPFDVPPGKQLQIRPAGPSETLKKYTVDNSQKSWATKDPITVRGRLVFQDIDGIWRPLVNVSVNLWDDDFGLDEHLGVTSTDWAGNWSFSVNNDDGFWQDGRDIYYSFKLENTRIRVQDCDGIDSTYEWESGVHDDLSDGAVVDFGTETGDSNNNAMQIWSYLNLGWNHSVTSGGQDPGFVDSCYPEDGGTHWDRFWEEIDIEEEFNDGPDVVTHEYGHAIMWYAYGEDNPSPGGSHGFDDCPQDAGLSWSEGWATGFMLSARPDGSYNWHEGDGGRNIENFNATCQTGERNEGRVAAAINDMLDAGDDCNGGNLNRGRNEYCDTNNANRVSLSTIIRDTLWGSYHTDMLDFWYSLSGELATAQRTPAHTIMYYNWMSVTEPTSCVATKIVTANDRDQETTLSGLRKFRDQGLKTSIGGQHLINTYYRNSPEMAEIFMKDEKLREKAMAILKHFSQLGEVLTSNAAFQKTAQSNRPVISAEMMGTITEVLREVRQKASPALKKDLTEIRLFLDKMRGLSLSEFAWKLQETKRKREATGGQRIRKAPQNPASTEAGKRLRDQFMTVTPPPDLQK